MGLYLLLMASFNTSYVSVQGEPYVIDDEKLMFQYILCVGSSSFL